MIRTFVTYAVGLCLVAGLATAAGEPAGTCVGFGPQTPRDIDSPSGENRQIFSTAPAYRQMNLCNIHFHVNAEHKAEDFSIYAGEGHDGHGGGYKCNDGESLTPAELAAPAENHCTGVESGDTVEVHWVYSSCDVEPGEGLGSCLSETRCVNPDLRVETQVFIAVDDPSALDFADFSYDGNIVDGRHQAKALPAGTGEPVVFLGSTTGPKYSDQKCSPLQVTWSVRPRCAKLDLGSLSEWCEDNVFEETGAHGVRELVTDLELLAEIR